MLPRFRIRNLRPTSQSRVAGEAIIQITTYDYDKTISRNPAASLKYLDEDDGDIITVGSSQELVDRLEEPLPCASALSSKERMSIALLLAQSQEFSSASSYHVFDIEDGEDVQNIWAQIQQPSDNGCHSSWSPNEDAKLIKLCKTGKNWLEISQLMPGRGSTSCKPRYQERFERDHEHDDKIKSSLGKIEAVNESVAENKKVQRPNATSTAQEKLGDVSPMDSSDNYNLVDHFEGHPAPGFPKLENFRAHHFNATRPPQITSSEHDRLKSTERALPFEKSKVEASPAVSGPTSAASAANLTMEGRRQAQAAGDRLRARATSSRQNKLAIPAIDQVSRQNRWADYKSPHSGFNLEGSMGLIQNFNGPSSTLEGKRQAQIAGDKLRCSTNPIRHYRSSTVGLDHGITKNRWSTYGSTHLARSDERPDGQAESTQNSQVEFSEQGCNSRRASLLEVFEAELASQTSKTSDHVPVSQESGFKDTVEPNPETGEVLPRQVTALVNQINTTSHGLQDASIGHRESTEENLRHGFRTAVSGLGICMQGVAHALQEISSIARQAADNAQSVDPQVVENNTLGLRNLARDINALSRDYHLQETNPNRAYIDVDSNIVASNALENQPTEKLAASSENGSLPIEDIPSARHTTSQDGSPNLIPSNLGQESQTSELLAASGSTICYAPRALTPRFVSDLPVAGQQHSGDPTWPQSGPVNRGLRFRKSGPIHLPLHASVNKATSKATTQASSAHPGYVDRLRHSLSLDTSEPTSEPSTDQITSSSELSTRFPTLAQFEGQNFASIPRFPPLPTMEPLVPSRPANPRRPSTTEVEVEGLSSKFGADHKDQFHFTESSNASESSGQFFHRMTALCQPDTLINLQTPKSPRLSPAARLAEPFDPLEAEPSARPHLEAGIRRNATTGSHGRYTTRRRRPYSDTFSGDGRLGWRNASRHSTNLSLQASVETPPIEENSVVEQTRTNGSRPQKSREVSEISPREYDDEHQDASTVKEIHECVSQLKELGFGKIGDGSGARLVVYAQAANGDLMDCIDMIEEEQQAFKECLDVGETPA